MSKILWLDLETTGLSPFADKILEVGAVVTDQNYEVIDQFEQAIFWNDEVFENMNDWCKKTHHESGLVQACKNSGFGIYSAAEGLAAFIQKHFTDQKPVLHGNSVHFDKKFIDQQMPEVSKLLHYRLVDISSVKEFLKPLNVAVYEPEKTVAHRAIDDILGSIAEAKHYRKWIIS